MGVSKSPGPPPSLKTYMLQWEKTTIFIHFLSVPRYDSPAFWGQSHGCGSTQGSKRVGSLQDAKHGCMIISKSFTRDVTPLWHHHTMVASIPSWTSSKYFLCNILLPRPSSCTYKHWVKVLNFWDKMGIVMFISTTGGFFRWYVGTSHPLDQLNS